MTDIAQTPAPPYYAVIFTSRRTERDEGYAGTAKRQGRVCMVGKEYGF